MAAAGSFPNKCWYKDLRGSSSESVVKNLRTKYNHYDHDHFYIIILFYLISHNFTVRKQERISFNGDVLERERERERRS